VADAIEEADLLALGRAARSHRLVTGGSGIAMGLPANFGIAPAAASVTFRGADGPALVLSGSCSGATRAQVAAYAAGHPSMKIAAEDALDAEQTLQRALDFVEHHRGDAPMVYSTDAPDRVSADQKRFGRERLAASYDGIFARLASQAMERGFRRIVVAGGETSGAVATALGAAALEIGPEIATGVPALLALSEPTVALALKSGNFGDSGFFERAVEMLGGEP
jgi:uncharacterized protein YgbK (DUF1537 family)